MLKAVILDWAGTVIDHGSQAPVEAFTRAFGQFGVSISVDEARAPMGLDKRDHIRAIGQIPAVASAWKKKHGRPFAETDVAAIYDVFEPLNIESVREHAEFIPGALEAVAEIQNRGLRIGSTTGYTRPIMDVIMPIAAAAGYKPEIVVCAGDLPAGRPSPLMMWHAMSSMGVWPASAVVKVDDTPAGIGEGSAAGTWTVGLALTGNLTGLSAEELAALTDGERSALRGRATRELTGAGADLVIDSIAQLPEALDHIGAFVAAGGEPGGPASER
jgi:phosphonoacetaldehyde hydrolase